MPELNFRITGDESDLKKKLENVSKLQRETNDQLAKDISSTMNMEQKERKKSEKATLDQRRASQDVVASVNEEVKAHDAATAAIKRKSAAFDENGRQIKPVQISNSQAEVDNASKGRTGTILSGPVVSTTDIEYARAAQAALDYGRAASDANKAATTGATAATEAIKGTTEAIKGTVTAQSTLEARIQSYKSITRTATDPAIIAEYKKKIEETGREIAKLSNIGKRGFDELGNRIKATIGLQENLTNRLRYFQSQLQYAKAPESFVQLNRKIQETEANLNRLANAGKKGFDELGNAIAKTDAQANKFSETIKKIAASLLAAFSIQLIVDWAKEARELAARGEGIRDAFSKLGNEKTLNNLRTATRGATSDIDLMAAALRAKNFKIAPELLAKGLELAGKVSRQTGQDVTYLTDSFVNGLGRKSLLILDNLQISQVQLRAEIKKTGNFQTAVANVVNEKLASMGDVAMTTADKMAQFATKIANIKEKIGQGINFVLNHDSLRDATNAFYETGLSVQNLQKNISPLLTKYDQLSEKAQKNGGITKLTKEEQALMKDVIRQVGEEIPTAITQFDKYGKAMDINTESAREFIKQQVLVMQALNAERIEKTTDKLKKLSYELYELQDAQDQITKTAKIGGIGTFDISENVNVGTGGVGSAYKTVVRKATAREVAEVVARRKIVAAEIEKNNALLNADYGKMLTDRQAEIDKNNKIDQIDDGKAEAAAEKAADRARRAKEAQAAADDAAISAQESLLQRIQALKDKYARQGLSKEEEARQAITDEFKKLAFDIEQQARKYEAYARKYGAKRAGEVLGPKPTTQQIEPMRKAFIEDLTYRQGTDKLKVTLAEQKQLYVDYEEYKKNLGKAAADGRFRDELKTNVSFLEKLQIEYSKVTAVGEISGYTPAMVQRQTVLAGEIKKELQAEQKKYDGLLKEFIAYGDQRKAMTEKFNADLATMEGNSAAQLVRKRKYAEDVKQLDNSNIQQLDAYKALFAGIDKLSDDGAKKVISNAKTMLAGLLLKGNIGKEMAKEISNMISNTEKAIEEKIPEKIIGLANQMDQVSASVSGIDEAFGKVLATLGNVIGQVGNIKKGFADIKTAQAANGGKGDAFGGLTAGLGVFGAGISIFQTVFSLFDRSAKREEQAAYSRDLQIKQTEAVTKALDRQLEMINEVYGTEKLTKYAEGLETIKAKQAELTDQLSGKYQFTGDKTIDKYVEMLNNGEKMPFAIKGLIDQLVEKGALTNVPKGLEELRDLLENGKLDQKTAAIAEALINLDKQAKDTFNALSAEKVGSSLENIADGFMSALMDGTQDFGKSFEDVIQKSIVNGFKGELIRKQLQEFYKQFADVAAGGLTKEEIEALRTSYLSAGEKAKKQMEDLEKITGISLTDKDKTSNTIKGSIQNISAQQADVLSGHFAGMRIAQIEANSILKPMGLTMFEQLNVAKSHLDVALKIEANTFRTANNTENLSKLSTIESALVSMDKTMRSTKDAGRAAGWG